jgi:hypothetical protein
MCQSAGKRGDGDKISKYLCGCLCVYLDASKRTHFLWNLRVKVKNKFTFKKPFLAIKTHS